MVLGHGREYLLHRVLINRDVFEVNFGLVVLDFSLVEIHPLIQRTQHSDHLFRLVPFQLLLGRVIDALVPGVELVQVVHHASASLKSLSSQRDEALLLDGREVFLGVVGKVFGGLDLVLGDVFSEDFRGGFQFVGLVSQQRDFVGFIVQT